MALIEAAAEIRNQSPFLAGAYLWTLVSFMGLCFVLGYIDHRRNK